MVDTPLFRDHPEALNHIDFDKDFALPADEVVDVILMLLTESSYPSGTILEVGDLGVFREVKLLNDPGPQGRSAQPREKAQEAVKLVYQALKGDLEVNVLTSKL